MGLLYPTLDPAVFGDSDNTVLALRIAYDLLAQLQHDMQQEGVQHPFNDRLLPVPSRHRLVAELEADGYTIRGNVAVQDGGRTASGAASGSLLARLRTLARFWTAPQIALPPQATPEDYQEIIARVLSAIVADADRAMLQALAQRLDMQPAATGETIRLASLPTRLPSVPETPQPRPAPQPTRPPSVSGTSQSRSDTQSARRDWASDFAAPPTRRQPAKTHPPGGEVLPKRGGAVSAKDDWIKDLLAERGPPPQRETQHHWQRDFDTASETPKPHENDWSDDFA